MFRYAFLLACGISITHYCNIPTWCILFVCAGTITYLTYRFFYTTALYKTHVFICTCMLAFALGMLRQQLWENHETPAVKQLRITSFPQKQLFQIQFEATTINTLPFAFFDAETFLVTCADTSLNLKYGAVFTTAKTAVPIEAPALPVLFDYKTYLYGKGITHKLELCRIVTEPDAGITAFVYHWIQMSREQFKHSTAQIFKTPASKALAESLLLGYREELDNETKDTFLKSGVSHLLAVSGMHTALIYEALFILFLPFGSSQKHRIIFLVTALFVLSYFTLLSGCSASVLRASVMCSMFAVAYAFRKRSSGLNTLGASMLVILWCSPYQLWNLGFQLSVLAVTGILTLHTFINRSIAFDNRVCKYVFEGLSITVCAQITTLPVVLYHFKSFPVYFIPANLILIPVSTGALFASMLSIFLAGLGLSVHWLFACNQWLIELFSACAAFFAGLPDSSIYSIFCSPAEAWLIVCIVAYYIQYPFVLNKRTILICMLVCMSWSCYRIGQEYKTEQQHMQLFISQGKKSALLSVHGLSATIYTQMPLKSFDRAKINAYFSIRDLNEVVTGSQNSGLIATTGNKRVAWIYKKNCTAVDMPMAHLFSYKERDSLQYKPEYYHSLKTTCMVYF